MIPHKGARSRILITGSSGFLGRHLVAGMAAVGVRGIAVSRKRGALPLPTGWSSLGRDEVLRESAPPRDVGAVVHLEVKQHVTAPSAADVAEFQRVNVDGTQTWLDWCSRAGVQRFVCFSSIKAVQPSAAGPTLETAPPNQLSVYGRSKWEAEQKVHAWAKADRSNGALILRPAVIYGRGNTANVAAMVNAIRRKAFFLVGPNNNKKSLVSAGNVVAAAIHLLSRMETGKAETFNLVDSETVTVRELDRRIRACLGRSGNSPTLPLPLARIGAWFGDSVMTALGVDFPINSPRLAAMLEATEFSSAKLLQAGFRPPQELSDGLAELVSAAVKVPFG